MLQFWPYITLLIFGLALYLWRHHHVQRRHVVELVQSKEAGLMEPPSLHPVVDPVRCLGSGSCAKACPEQALGVVNGRAVLVNASACIGHGACLSACPVDAIHLVFGTATRGVDIPHVSPDFETNVPGIFIAGELGGMGLIRKATEQGRQAMEAIRRRGGGRQAGRKADFDVDVLIVGCGPAGLSAGLAALQHGLRYRLIEQEDSLGGAVYHYPRNKITMTAPAQLPVVGPVRFNEVSKETLLDFWLGVVAKTGLKVHYRERLTGLERAGEGFVVQTDRGQVRARSVLLAMGRRGTPRKLNVPGEEASKVVYRLADPSQYQGQQVLVVGGGDSALEAAVSLADQASTTVTLAYRSAAFSRVKGQNRLALQAAEAAGRVQVLLSSEVAEIATDFVRLKTTNGPLRLNNQAVIVCAGGELPTPLLQRMGIQFQTHFGQPPTYGRL